MVEMYPRGKEYIQYYKFYQDMILLDKRTQSREYNRNQQGSRSIDHLRHNIDQLDNH